MAASKPTAKRASLSPAAVEKLREKYAALPPPVPASYTLRQAVLQLKTEIAHLRTQGYTFAQIADLLNSDGIPVAQSTLRHYAAQAAPRKRAKYKTPEGVRKAPSPRKAVSKSKAADSKSSAPPPQAKPEPERKRGFVIKPDSPKL